MTVFALQRRFLVTYQPKVMEIVMNNWFRTSSKTRPTAKAGDPARFKRLPAHVNVRDTIAIHPVTPARDPYGSRDTERDFVIRYGDPFDE